MDFGPIDTVMMARACGVDAVRTSDPAELAASAARAVAERRNLVIAVPVDYADYRKLF
jgi:thiamine pyrophosphate-dependent acetolactate synthase large subunit-like protein